MELLLRPGDGSYNVNVSDQSGRDTSDNKYKYHVSGGNRNFEKDDVSPGEADQSNAISTTNRQP